MRGLALVLWCLVPVVFVLMLAAPSVRPPGDGLGIRRFQTPSLVPDLRLGQTFTMDSNGLHAIDFRPAAVSDNVSGNVRVSLYDVTLERGPRPLVRSAEISAADLVNGPSYRFEFPPILDSQYRKYRLELSSETSPAEGVALWATKGERYEEGAMRINDADRWADLAFQTHAPAPSIWRLLMTLRQTNPVRAYVVVAALAATWLLLGVALRGLVGMADEAGAGRAAPS